MLKDWISISAFPMYEIHRLLKEVRKKATVKIYSNRVYDLKDNLIDEYQVMSYFPCEILKADKEKKTVSLRKGGKSFNLSFEKIYKKDVLKIIETVAGKQHYLKRKLRF
jgi:hypothetical protein